MKWTEEDEQILMFKLLEQCPRFSASVNDIACKWPKGNKPTSAAIQHRVRALKQKAQKHGIALNIGTGSSSRGLNANNSNDGKDDDIEENEEPIFAPDDSNIKNSNEQTSMKDVPVTPSIIRRPRKTAYTPSQISPLKRKRATVPSDEEMSMSSDAESDSTIEVIDRTSPLALRQNPPRRLRSSAKYHEDEGDDSHRVINLGSEDSDPDFDYDAEKNRAKKQQKRVGGWRSV